MALDALVKLADEAGAVATYYRGIGPSRDLWRQRASLYMAHWLGDIARQCRPLFADDPATAYDNLKAALPIVEHLEAHGFDDSLPLPQNLPKHGNVTNAYVFEYLSMTVGTLVRDHKGDAHDWDCDICSALVTCILVMARCGQALLDIDRMNIAIQALPITHSARHTARVTLAYVDRESMWRVVCAMGDTVNNYPLSNYSGAADCAHNHPHNFMPMGGHAGPR